MSEKVCILHDQLLTRGGAERVAFELAREFDAPIYAAKVNSEIIPRDVTAVEAFDSKLAAWAMNSHYMVQDTYQMLAWQHVEPVYEHDVVILNKTNPAWFVPRDTQTTIWYVHSTPRNLYDRFHETRHGLLDAVITSIQRTLYQQNTRYADAWIANSELVARRLQRYWNIKREAIDVRYPPVQMEDYRPTESPAGPLVTVSRLEDHKRIDSIIRACNRLEQELIIAGDGRERERLEALAGPTVTLRGYVSEEEKRKLLEDASGFVFAAINEDFGMAPIEAMAAGTPVIGIKEGYTKHQILDGKNGLIWSRSDGVEEAIRRFKQEGVEWSAHEIGKWAQRFSARTFRREMRRIVEEAEDQARVETPWEGDSRVYTREPQQSARADTDGGRNVSTHESEN